jgi:hypothetical protein
MDGGANAINARDRIRPRSSSDKDERAYPLTGPYLSKLDQQRLRRDYGRARRRSGNPPVAGSNNIEPYAATARSWNAAHTSRGCSQQDLIATGSNGLFYRFAER